MFKENAYKVIGDYSYSSTYCIGEGAFGKVY